MPASFISQRETLPLCHLTLAVTVIWGPFCIVPFDGRMATGSTEPWESNSRVGPVSGEAFRERMLLMKARWKAFQEHLNKKYSYKAIIASCSSNGDAYSIFYSRGVVLIVLQQCSFEGTVPRAVLCPRNEMVHCFSLLRQEYPDSWWKLSSGMGWKGSGWRQELGIGSQLLIWVFCISIT